MSLSWTDLLATPALMVEGATVNLAGQDLKVRNGILRAGDVTDDGQAQTRDMFGFKWAQKGSYKSDHLRHKTKDWLIQRYGDLLSTVRNDSTTPVILDAGCGSGFTAGLLFGERLRNFGYVGADISSAVDLARDEIQPLAAQSLFLQCDLMKLPFAAGSFDLVYSEGVLHHTPSTRAAVETTAALVKPGGVFAIYVYARKAPAREFTDDHIRALLADMSPEAAWSAVRPLTLLGQTLGDLNVEVDVKEEVKLLGIPAGKINLQRLFYWYICKMYFDPKLDIEEMNHINFDWFAPRYSHRQTPEDVRTWCEGAGLTIERMVVEEAGITVVARRPIA